jgi:pyruvate dehydrogenase E2 component (dihydrolipoamide acetyltransferase)
MTINILMPALSPTMEEGTLARWFVKEGDHVSPGAILAEIETDKATMEFEAVDEGTIGKLVVPEGTQGIKVNDLIAVLLEDGENPEDVAATPKPEAQPSATAASEPATEPPAAGEPRAAAPERSGDRVFASPLARRLAAERGLNLRNLKGSGPNGRIVRADVLAAEAAPATPRAPLAAEEKAPAPAAAAARPSESLRQLYAERPFEEVELDGMRRTIANRLSEAKQTIPHFYLRRDVRLDALLAFRSQLNAQLADRQIKLSVNDFIIKASALALQQVPACNAIWAGDRILQFRASDVAVAVAVEGGLFTPVLRDADSRSLSSLSLEMKDLAARARDRKLAPHEYQGGSFAISNLGMMGIESFDAVINPPHAAILAVGAGVARPVVGESGEIEVGTMMTLTLSVDHRVIDGALGARLLEAIKQNLEHPLPMLA